MKVSTVAEIENTELVTAAIEAVKDKFKMPGGGVTVTFIDNEGREVPGCRAIVKYNWANK